MIGSRRRIGTNELREIERRRAERAAALVAAVRRALRAGRLGMFGAVCLSLAAVCACSGMILLSGVLYVIQNMKKARGAAPPPGADEAAV